MPLDSQKENGESTELKKTKISINQNLELLKKDFPEKSKEIDDFKNFLENIENPTIEKLLNSLIGFLDIHFINQILNNNGDFTEGNGENKLVSRYGRDRNHSNLADELDSNGVFSLILSWTSQKNVSNYLNFKSLPNSKYNVVIIDENDFNPENLNLDNEKYNIFIFNSPISINTARKLLKMPLSYNYSIFGIIDFGKGLFGEVFYPIAMNENEEQKCNDLSELIEILGKNRNFPTILPDIQSVIKQRILLGLSIYGEKIEQNPIPNCSEEVKNQVHSIVNKRLRKTFRLKSEANSDKINELILGHKRHYQRFFKEVSLPEPNIFFSNSGVSANDAVIEYLLSEVGSDYSKFSSDNFYYENLTSGKIQKSVKNETRILLTSPSILVLRENESQKNHKRRLKNGIKKMISNALSNPSEKFYIVFDVTTNMNFKLSDIYDGEIPENLIIIKTCSLTKHQRGETNYFLGGVSVYGNEDISNGIGKSIENNGYNISREQAISIPRITREEITRNFQNVRKNRASFKKGLKKGFEKYPIDSALMPKIIDSDYFSFIVPAIPEILQIGKGNEKKEIDLKTFPELVKGKSLKTPFGYDTESIPSFVSIFTRLFSDIETLYAASFGLNQNNIGMIYQNFMYLYGKKLDLNYKQVEIPRVSFGIKDDREKAFNLGFELAYAYGVYLKAVGEYYN